jgi:hypothetical protein
MGAPRADGEDVDLGGLDSSPEGDLGGVEGDLGGGDASGAGDFGSAGAGGDAVGGDLGGAEGDLAGDEGEGGGDLGGGGGGFGGGFGGGGGGFGDDGDLGADGDGEVEEEDTASTFGPEDLEAPEDPVAEIVSQAISQLGDTREPQKILRQIKASIQRHFSDAEEAAPVIKSLWDTEDPTLRDVARRLLLFIKGT